MKTIARRYSEVRRLPISEPVARAREGAGGHYFEIDSSSDLGVISGESMPIASMRCSSTSSKKNSGKNYRRFRFTKK